MPRYHWVLTLRVFSRSGGSSFIDGHGDITPIEGTTRRQLLNESKAHLCNQAGIDPAQAVIEFWSLELDELL